MKSSVLSSKCLRAKVETEGDRVQGKQLRNLTGVINKLRSLMKRNGTTQYQKHWRGVIDNLRTLVKRNGTIQNVKLKKKIILQLQRHG
jgi:hypothetical protein